MSKAIPLVWLFFSAIVLMHFARMSVVANIEVDTKKQAYIVYMGERKHSDVEKVKESHHEMLASVLGSKEAAMDSMLYSYKHGFSGFAAMMTESQAKYFQGLSGVVQVFPNQLHKVQTTRSWDFLGLSTSSTNNLLHDTNQGDGAIIGVIDSGVWPESESFNDKGLGPIPSKWKGFCESGEAFVPSKHCNKKLIGARYFIKGFLAILNETFNATENNDYLSPRDADGHGTHCASTAGGSLVDHVNLTGLAPGTARGGAPRARIAVYKAIWLGAASSADVLKAFDEAIHDGVNVLSVSLGIEVPVYPEFDKRDIVYYGSFHAVANGITVVCSAGNSGPLYQSVEDVAPWVITVAATTLDRSFPTPIILGNNQVFETKVMYVGVDTGFVNLAFHDRESLGAITNCEDITTNDTWVAGKMVLCFTTKGDEAVIGAAANIVIKAGGIGLIATQKNYDSAANYYSHLPVMLVTFDVGVQILNYFRFTKGPMVRVRPSKTYIGKQATTYVASFSSRGPNSLSPTVLKPDIAAPGVDILSAIPGGYGFLSGTSMATPHIAGIVALLKSMHPNWSPAAIRSAIVTTAWTTDPYSGEPIYARGEIPRIANRFDYGGGLVNPNAARDPGLVYDMGTQDYVYYLCAMGYPKNPVNQFIGQAKSCLKSGNSVLNLNLPSITVPNLKSSVTLTRTVTNVGDSNSKYQVIIEPPQGTVVEVIPMYLLFNPKIKKMSFNVTITTFHKVTTEYYFGSLTWTDDNNIHNVKIPISVRTEFPHVYGN